MQCNQANCYLGCLPADTIRLFGSVFESWSTITKRANMKMKPRPHPGDLIRTEIIEALGLSVTLAANALGVPEATLLALLNEKAALSVEMALRMEKAFGPKMDHLLRMQLAYDIVQMRRHEHEIKVAPYVPAGDRR